MSMLSYRSQALLFRSSALAIAIFIGQPQEVLSQPQPPTVQSTSAGVDRTFKSNAPLVSFSARYPTASGAYTPPPNSSFWSAKPATDENGIPYFEGVNGERHYNVASVAFAAIGSTTSYPELDMAKLSRSRSALTSKQVAAFSWLERNQVRLPGGAITWHYNFELNYNNMVVRPGWPSAFSQAAVIQAYLVAFDVTKEEKYLSLAHQAARAFLISTDEGGLTSQVKGLPFFEEVPLPAGYSPHVLNGHMYSVFAIEEVLLRRQDQELRAVVSKAHEATKRLLPAFDQGYWTRYDLKPRFVDVPFKFQATGPGTTVLGLGIRAPDGSSKQLNVISAAGGGGRDVLYGPGWTQAGSARALGSEDAFGQFMLPTAVDDEANLRGYKLVVRLSEGSYPPNIGIFGFRQGIREYYPIRLEGVAKSKGESVATYELALRDLQWSDLQRYYVEWHQRLMSSMYRYDRDPTYAVAAYRWQNYLAIQASDLIKQLTTTGGVAMTQSARAVGVEVKQYIASRRAVISPRTVIITDSPDVDAEIFRALGNESLEKMSGKEVVERLIGSASPTDATPPLGLASKLRRLGFATRVFEFSEPGAGAAVHLIEVDLDGSPAAYDPRAGIGFEVGGAPASVGSVLASYAIDRPPIPAVAGVVPAQPDQIVIRPLRGIAPEYELAVNNGRLRELLDPALAGVSNVATRPVSSVGAKVLSSTPFYSGYGPELALGVEKAGAYAAGREGLKTNAFSFMTAEPMTPTELEISWNSVTDFPQQLKLVGVSGKDERTLLDLSGFKPEGVTTRIPIQSDRAYQTFRFEAGNFIGQDRLIITRFRINGMASDAK